MGDASFDQSDPAVPPSGGFSPLEKAAGAWAAYEHPLAASFVADRMLQTEADPTRRAQLGAFRRNALIWWGVGLVIALIAFAVMMSIATSGASAGGSCRGGIDRYDVMNTTYQSTDGTHWTATYPCVNGGETTVPVPRSAVPGGGR